MGLSNNTLSPEITTEIVRRAPEIQDVRALARNLSEQFGQMITVAMVRQVLSTSQRRTAITEAKDRASAGLEGVLDLTDEIKDELADMWRDSGIAAKDRIAAVRELRQWAQMGVDMSGIKDEDTGVVFALASAWNTHPELDEESST
jgi:hypothetical protein